MTHNLNGGKGSNKLFQNIYWTTRWHTELWKLRNNVFTNCNMMIRKIRIKYRMLLLRYHAWMIFFWKLKSSFKTNKRFLSFTNFGEKQSEGKQAFIFFLFWSLYNEPPMFYSHHEFTIYISVGLCLLFGYFTWEKYF